MEFNVAETMEKFKALKLRASVLLFFFTALIGLAGGWAQAAPSKEYEVKAALLLNFVQFVQWPASAFIKPDSPITVGVLGDDPFGPILEQTFQDEIIQGHKIAVIRSPRVEDMRACQMVFICKSEKDQISQILPRLSDAAVVTVSEIDQFAQRGGIINFYIESGKVRFELNAGAAQRRGIKINSQLLKRAKIVASDSGKGGE